MSTNPLLDALLRNESGGRNIANTDEGTSSGQAQGHFQITTGTWRDFGGGKYAPTPLGATYEQQADIASKIPLKRWDPSTIAAMRATGLPVNPNQTLGQNLGGNFDSSKYGLGVPGTGITSYPKGQSNAAPLPPPTTIQDHPIAGIMADPSAAPAAPNTDVAAAAPSSNPIMDAITKLTTDGPNNKPSPLGALASALGGKGSGQAPPQDNIIQTGALQSSDMMQQAQVSNAQQLMQSLIAKRKAQALPTPGMGLMGMNRMMG